jgi:Peptidase family S41
MTMNPKRKKTMNKSAFLKPSAVLWRWMVAIALLWPTVSIPAQTTQPVPGNDSIPKALNQYVRQISTNVPFLELPDFAERRPPEVVTKSQALEDIAMLEYILDTAYSGKTYWANQGINFSALAQALRAYVAGRDRDEVPVAGLEDIIFEYLQNMTDGHTKIIGLATRELARGTRAYFAEVIVEKKEQGFVVVESKEPNVAVGDDYTDSRQHLFRTLSRPETERYLIGELSSSRLDTLAVSFKNTPRQLPLHPCRIGDVDYPKNQPVESREVQTIPVVRTTSFMRRFDGPLRAFAESGKSLKDRKVVVWDLLNNDGGDAGYARRFIENLNGSAVGFQYLLTLHSPAIAQAYLPGKNLWLKDFMPAEWLRADADLKSLPPEVREIRTACEREAEAMKQNPRMYWEVTPAAAATGGRFKSKLIVLSNQRVGSAANNAVALAKSVPGCIVIGCNTSSGFTFAEVVTYCLKHTAIKLRLPRKITIHPEFDNERGFLPDYWLDSAQPLDEVIHWLTAPDTYQFSYRR